MKLATIRVDQGTTAVRVNEDGTRLTGIVGVPDVGALLTYPDWRERAAVSEGPVWLVDDLPEDVWAPVVPSPSKIVCVGLNYRTHILEMGRPLPEHPTLFAKYPEALIGARDPIRVPSYASSAVDWEGELAVIVGATVRHADESTARNAIAGYSVLNDVTMRDYQYRTAEWFQGKTFENSAPFGPLMVTADEFVPGAKLRTSVDRSVVQAASTDDLLFGPAALVAYISTIFTLRPGDVIATGTPGGVGHGREPKRYLTDGAELTTWIEGIGMTVNRVVVEG